jgi:hypothetical protein
MVPAEEFFAIGVTGRNESVDRAQMPTDRNHFKYTAGVELERDEHPESVQCLADAPQAWRADVIHDRERRADYVRSMKAAEQVYTAAEDAVVARGSSLFDTCVRQHGRARRLKCPPTVSRLQTNYDVQGGVWIGEGEAVILGATPEHVVAYLMDLKSKHFQSRLNRNLYPCYEVREIVNEHHSIMFNQIRFPPFQSRTMVVSLVWKKLCDEPLTYVWSAVSIDGHVSVRPEDEADAVRADLARCVKLTALSSHSTLLELATSLDLKGNFPVRATLLAS